MNFGNWNEEIHNDAEQIKRFEKAKSASVSPQSIDINNMSGVFSGSGKNPYNVTLDYCPCGDFHRRKLPCKHIYRLAMELNLINGDFNTGINQNKFNQQLFSMPAATQKIFYDMCCEIAYHKQFSFVFSRNDTDDIMPIIVNGFCVEALNDFENVLSTIPVNNFKALYDDFPEDNKPKYNAQKKTYIKWFSLPENADIVNDKFIIVEANEQTKKKAHTYISRFRKKFIKIESSFDEEELFYTSPEYEEIFNNEII